MEESLLSAIHWLLAVLALPSVGLSAIFTVSLVSATLLPLGSEPAVFGYIKLAPDMFWPAVLVATLGNTIGGAISYAMGLAAERAVQRWKENTPSPRVPSRCRAGRTHARPLEPARARLAAPHGSAGAAAVLAAGRGRPAVRRGRVAAAVILACVAYMAIGKFLRYVAMTAGLLWFFPGSSDASDLSENKGTYQ